MKTNIYIVEGCKISYLGRTPEEYQFNLGTYATVDLAEGAIANELASIATKVDNYRFTGKHTIETKFYTYKFVVNTITFES